MRPFEMLQKRLDLFDLALGVIEVIFSLCFPLGFPVFKACICIQRSCALSLHLHGRRVVKVSLVLASALLLGPLFFEGVRIKIHLICLIFIKIILTLRIA